jgi:hypothetical protein
MGRLGRSGGLYSGQQSLRCIRTKRYETKTKSVCVFCDQQDYELMGRIELNDIFNVCCLYHRNTSSSGSLTYMTSTALFKWRPRTSISMSSPSSRPNECIMSKPTINIPWMDGSRPSIGRNNNCDHNTLGTWTKTTVLTWRPKMWWPLTNLPLIWHNNTLEGGPLVQQWP